MAANHPKDAYYPGSWYLKAAQAYGAGVVNISVKPKEVRFNGGIFLDLSWNVAGPQHKGEGRVTVQDVPLSQGAANVNDPTDFKVLSKTEKTLSFSVEALGDYGKFLELASPHCVDKLTALKDADKIDTAKIKPLYRTHYSKKSSKVELRGQPMEHPMVDIGLDWGTYSAKHYKKHLASKPKMNIYDADKPMVNDDGEQLKDDKGNELYHLATVLVDGVEQSICKENAHLFLVADSQIVLADIHMDSCFVNDNQASIPLKFATLVVRKGSAGAPVRISNDAELDLMNQPPHQDD